MNTGTGIFLFIDLFQVDWLVFGV